MAASLMLLPGLILAIVIMPAAVKADPIVLTLNPLQNGAAGSQITFQGTFVNGGATTLFVTGVSLTLAGSPNGFIFDATDFFAAVPFNVDPGFVVGPTNFFSVLVNSAVTPRTYTGSFTVLGGETDDAEIPLAFEEFTIQVTPASPQVPETATLFMLGAGLTALATIVTRRHKR